MPLKPRASFSPKCIEAQQLTGPFLCYGIKNLTRLTEEGGGGGRKVLLSTNSHTPLREKESPSAQYYPNKPARHTHQSEKSGPGTVGFGWLGRLFIFSLALTLTLTLRASGHFPPPERRKWSPAASPSYALAHCNSNSGNQTPPDTRENSFPAIFIRQKWLWYQASKGASPLPSFILCMEIILKIAIQRVYLNAFFLLRYMKVVT